MALTCFGALVYAVHEQCEMPGTNLLAALVVASTAISGGSPATKLVPNVQTLVQQGYDHFYNLEYSDAIADFQKAVDLDPDDPDLHNHLAEAIVFQEMYRDGALESELISGVNSLIRQPKLNPAAVTERRLLDQVALAIAIGEQRLNKDPTDVDALYALGIAYGLRASYYWVVRKSWRDSLRDATISRRLHNRITELQPDDTDARLVQGLHDYIVGALPWQYRVLGFLAGIRGDKQEGIRTIREVAQNGKLDRVDAEVFLCVLYRRENQPREAIPFIQDLIERYPRNYLFRMELSQMYSMAGDKEHAMDAVGQVVWLKTRGASGYAQVPWEKIWFQEGTIEFWYKDWDSSLDLLKKVVARSDELDLNTVAYAYLRIGQIYDLTGRRSEALRAYAEAMAVAPKSDAVPQCRRYLASPYRRN